MTGARPALRDLLAGVIERDRREGVSSASPADALVTLLDGEARQRCRDRDCVRLMPHGRLAPHLWRHEAQPPFTRYWLSWRCFTCGERKGHRVHKARSSR